MTGEIQKGIYLVGGSVRDLLLNHKPNDEDYLVVGMTEKEFLTIYPNARKVGKQFPVFLVDGKEYAFARTEKKIGKGHKGFNVTFSPEISLLEDLMRRDLTINAVAMDVKTGAIFMAPNAYKDLQNKILRHVSPAFAEDPLRVYRVARFAAQLPGFQVHTDTLKLMYSLKKELSSLPPERVWKETEKALAAKSPHRFFAVLKNAKVLDVHFPELARLIGVPAGKNKHKGLDAFSHTLKVLKRTASLTYSPTTRFAALCHDLGKGLTPAEEWPRHINHDKLGISVTEKLCQRLKTPNIFKKAGIMAARYHMQAHRLLEMRPGKAVRLLTQIFKNFPEGINEFLVVCIADGMSPKEAKEILFRSQKALSVKLPQKFHGLGAKAGSILLQLQAEAWKGAKFNFSHENSKESKEYEEQEDYLLQLR